jgi:site-specific DNA-methyltransferase (adenine-specific)
LYGGGYGFGVNRKVLTKKDWDKQIPNKEVFEEIFRVSKNQIIFGGNYFTQYLEPTKAWIIWDKIGNLELKNTFSQCELIWTSFNKVTKKITFIQQGFINDSKEENKFRFHPTQKPVELFQRILSDYSKEGDLILDCFSGSGTTAIACHNLKRRFICVEKDVDYWKASVERLERVQEQLELF